MKDEVEELREQNIKLKRKIKRGLIFVVITLLIVLYNKYVNW